MRTRCFECSDLGFVIKGGIKEICWRVAAFDDHAAPNDAAKMTARAVDHLHERGIVVDHYAFEIAKVLALHTSDQPYHRGNILAMHLAQSLRSFMGLIEHLRKVWLLPVGSRKETPAGYWIITDQADFSAWVQRAKSAPITQLATIAAVARRNFPMFAEQLELDFWQEMHGSDGVRQMKEAA